MMIISFVELSKLFCPNFKSIGYKLFETKVIILCCRVTFTLIQSDNQILQIQQKVNRGNGHG